jgi:chromate reductase
MSKTSVSILVVSASVRHGSLNRRLAALAERRLQVLGALVTQLDLAEYPLPIYNGDFEVADGIPAQAIALQEQFRRHDGVFIASPEYNSAISPLLVNVLNWVSRVTTNGGPAAAFGNQVFGLGAASPGGFGGYRGLTALRQMLELGLSARVLPTMITVPMAHEAFDAAGELVNGRSVELLDRVVLELVAASRRG